MDILFLGDSNTACGRQVTNLSSNQLESIGAGYVNYTLLFSQQKGLDWRLFNRGQNGVALEDAQRCLSQAQLPKRLDWVVVALGVNDLWRSVQGRVPWVIDELKQNYKQLIEPFAGRQVVTLLPGLEPKGHVKLEDWSQRFEQLTQMLKSEAPGPVLDCQALMREREDATTDGIHYQPWLHFLMAEALFKIIDPAS